MALPLLALGAVVLRAASPAIARILKSAGAKTVSSGRNIREIKTTDAARKAVQKTLAKDRRQSLKDSMAGKGRSERVNKPKPKPKPTREEAVAKAKETNKRSLAALKGAAKRKAKDEPAPKPKIDKVQQGVRDRLEKQRKQRIADRLKDDKKPIEKSKMAKAALIGTGVGTAMYGAGKLLKSDSEAKPKASSTTVSRGDTLSGIAKEAGVSLKEIMAANPKIDNANDIKVGQRIKIPSKSGRGTYEGMSRSEMRAISMDREDQGDTPFRKGGMVKKKNYGAMDYRKGGMVLNVTDRRKSRG